MANRLPVVKFGQAGVQQTGSLPVINLASAGGGGSSQNTLPVINLATAGNTPTPAPKPSGGGGFFSRIGGAIAQPFEAAGHYVAQQGENVGRGVAGIGTGLVLGAKAEGQSLYNDVRGRNKKLNSAEWSDLFHGHILRMFQEAGKVKGQNSPEAQVSGFDYGATVGYAKQAAQVAKNPGANLFNTATVVLPLAGGVAGVAGRAADAAAAARAGMSAADVAKIAVRGTEPSVRTLNLPNNRLVPPTAPEGAVGDAGVNAARGPAAKVQTTTPIQLNQGRSYLSRFGAQAHDVLAQRSLNKIPSVGKAGVIGRYAMTRAGKSIEETGNTIGNVRAVQVHALAHSKADANLSPLESSLATVLHAGNVLPEEMAAAWREGAATGVVKIPQEDGTIVSAKVKPADRQRMLAAAELADSLTGKGALRRGDTGDVEVNADQFPLLAQREQLVQGASNTREAAILATRTATPEDAASLAAGLQGRKNLVGRVAGVENPQGKAFVSLKPYEKQGGLLSRIARAGKGGSIPQTKPIPLGKQATGVGLALGHFPGDSAREVATGLQVANRVRNTNDIRGTTAAHGSDVRQTSEDWLVAKDMPERVASMPDHIKVLLGKLRDTSITPEEEHALAGEWQDWVKKNLLTRGSPEAVGQAAPEGWVWVHKNLVPDSLKSNELSRGSVEKQLAKLSTGVTAATVYFKPGHVPQRFATNAAANVIHGIVNPNDIRATRDTLKAMSKNDRNRLAAATGTHGYQSLPVEGTGFTARAASAGARWFAKNVDAIFRQHAALTELRRAGYDTPEKVSRALDAVEHGAKLPGHELMKIHGALRRANRAAMDYETNALEKRTIQRALWFYGFAKAATRFAGHTAIEHPGKFALLGAAGREGGKESAQILGPTASFAAALSPLSGGRSPLTIDPGVLVPTGNVANEAFGIKGPGQFLIQNLNPVYSGLAQGAVNAAEGKSAFGGFVSQAIQPAPETQAIAAALHPKRTGGSLLLPTSSKNLFGSTGASVLLRAFTGAALTPRRYNKAIGVRDAAREHQKKRTFTIYGR